MPRKHLPAVAILMAVSWIARPACVQAAADPNLIGWWRLDEGGGAVAKDSSGNGHDGAFRDNPQWVAGRVGGALQFDGVDDYVLCAERAGSSPGDYPAQLMPKTLTVSCWLKLNAFAYFSSFVGNGIDSGDDECGFFLYNSGWIGESGKDFGLAIRTETAMNYVETENIYETDTWYHLAATYDGTNVSIYVDGSLAVGPTVVGGPLRWVSRTTGNYPERLAIGVWLDPGYDLWVNGTIDDVRYYSRPLTEEEVRAIAQEGAELSSRPSPRDTATQVPRDIAVAWTPGRYAKTHDVYLGTLFEDVIAASRTDPKGVLASQDRDANTYDPVSLLAFGQTYYWRVDEVNAMPDATIYEGQTWSFTTETYGFPVKPAKATASSSSNALMGPEKTIDGSGLSFLEQHSVSASQMWLSKKNQSPIWIQYEFDTVYKLYQMWVWNSNQEVESVTGFGAKEVTIETSLDGIAWTALDGVPEFAQATGEPNYVHNTTVDLGGVLARYIKLTIKNNWAGTTKQAGLSEVRFFYVPVKAFGPSPATGATGLAVDGVLNWRPGREAVKHEVYLGADPNALALVDTVTAHNLGLGSLGLQYGQTYYWKVNEVNDVPHPVPGYPASWPGDLWSFTTIGYAVVDDFESYDDVCKRIFFSWVDGFGYSASADCGLAASAGNGTSSTVGNVSAPFAEKTIVHGGRQSMPMAFDNARTPYYSEADRQWPAAQSWTGGGANTLVVYVRGDAPAFLETSPGTVLMNGTGTDIWSTSDQLRFVYKSLKGNGSIVARVDSVANTDGWAKAGVMIRETLQSGAANALVAMTPSNGVTFQWRAATDDASSNTAVAGLSVPYWVKVTRTGTSIAAQYSADGVAWTDLAPATALTFTMANEVYIGLAMTSHVAGLVGGAKFSNVSTTGGVSGAWQIGEVGVEQLNGNSPGTFYVTLQDNAGTTKVVANADPTVIATGAWQEWDIPLSQFTSAGVNLGSIKKMIVGVGDRISPKAGSSGKVYIDDIRLTRVASP